MNVSSPKLKRMLEVLKFRDRFQNKTNHEAWLKTPEALIEILQEPYKAIWPEEDHDWND